MRGLRTKWELPAIVARLCALGVWPLEEQSSSRSPSFSYPKLSRVTQELGAAGRLELRRRRVDAACDDGTRHVVQLLLHAQLLLERAFSFALDLTLGLAKHQRLGRRHHSGRHRSRRFACVIVDAVSRGAALRQRDHASQRQSSLRAAFFAVKRRERLVQSSAVVQEPRDRAHVSSWCDLRPLLSGEHHLCFQCFPIRVQSCDVA